MAACPTTTTTVISMTLEILIAGPTTTPKTWVFDVLLLVAFRSETDGDVGIGLIWCLLQSSYRLRWRPDLAVSCDPMITIIVSKTLNNKLYISYIL